MKRIDIYYTSDSFVGKPLPKQIATDVVKHASSFFVDRKEDITIPLSRLGLIDAKGLFIPPKIYKNAEEGIFNYNSASEEDAIMIGYTQAVLVHKSCIWYKGDFDNDVISNVGCFLIKKLFTYTGEQRTDVYMHMIDKSGNESFKCIDSYNPERIDWRDIKICVVNGSDGIIDYMRPNKSSKRLYLHNIVDLYLPVNDSYVKDVVYYTTSPSIDSKYKNGKIVIPNALDNMNYDTNEPLTIIIDTKNNWKREYKK
jgi:hypothetical protein